jgi:hypothetical protein
MQHTKKRLITAALVFAGSVNALAQGSVVFSNAGGQPVLCGDGVTRIPVGSTFQAELVFAPDGTSSADFDSFAARVGPAASFGPVPGYFSGGGRTVDVITPAGGFGLFQVRVWAALAAGKSAILRVDTGNPVIGEPPASLVAAGLGQIIVYGSTPPCVPEPSTLAVAVIGGAVLLLVFRRKSSVSKLHYHGKFSASQRSTE